MKTFIIIVLSVLAGALGGNLALAAVPDLAPLSVAAATNQVVFDPPSPQAPTVQVTCVVTNEGLDAAVGYWYDLISISTDGTTNGIIGSQYFWNYYWDLPGVPSGGTYEEADAVSLPEQSGTYWLIVQANAGGYLYEADTTNNTLVAPVPVTVSYQVIPPDLAPLSLAAVTNQVVFDPPSPQAPTVLVTCVVTNEGLGAAVGSWEDLISISTDGTTNGIISSQYFWNYYWDPPGVPSGGNYEEADAVALPEQSGTYWLIFQANPNGYLYEANTNNNTMVASVPVTVTYQVVPPDLAPLSVVAATNQVVFDPPSPQAPTVLVTCVVTNEGLGAAIGGWDDVISISTDGTTNGIISSQAFWNYYWDLPGVPSGGTYEEADAVSLPEQSGTYWLIFQGNASGYLYEPDTNNNTMVASVPVTVSYQVVPPDLAPVGVTAATNRVVFHPSSPQAPSVTVSCVVTNEGLGAAVGYWDDVISISTNGTTSGIINSQYFWNYYWDPPGLPSGGAYEEAASVSLPEQNGTYWLIFQVDAGGILYEPDLTNNTLVASVPVTVSYQVVPPQLTPLSVVAASKQVAFYPPSPQPPTVPVTCVVANNGPGPAAGYWNDMISISTNATTNGIIASQEFGQWQYGNYYPGLPPGGVYRETNTVSLPEQSGTYWLFFQADADGGLYETNTGKSTMMAPVPVQVKYQVVPPDLAPVRIAAASNQVAFYPPSWQAPTIAVTCLVTNLGRGVAWGAWNDEISISTDGTMNGIITSQEFFQYYGDFPGVPSGGTYEETNEVSLPEQSGTYWLIFQANADGSLYETDTTNNTMVAAVPVTVTYQVVPPELAPVSVAALSNHMTFDPPSPQPLTIPVMCVVTNEGLGAAIGSWDDEISISTNGAASGIIDAQEFWQNRYSPGVPAGGTYTETNVVSLPEQSGTYWLIFQANIYGYLGSLYETVPTNNILVSPVPVTVSYQVVPPDLAPLNVAVATNQVTFDPPSPQAPTVLVTCVVTNAGLGAAVGNWDDVISISTDGTTNGIISSQTFWNYYWDPPGVPSGGTYEEADSVTLPQQSGTYWLIFQANAYGELYETDTANNTMVASVPVTLSYQVVPPDLAPVSVTAASNQVAFYPASPTAPRVAVTCIVTNEGLGAAVGSWNDQISISTNGTTSGIIGTQEFGQWQYQHSPSVPFGGVYAETDYVSLPEQSGTYWLIFQANADGGLYEADPTNNTMIASVPVTVTYQVIPPDLAPVSVAASNHVVFDPASPQAPTIPVTCVVTNEGLGAAAGDWYDVISISTNGTASGIISSQAFWQNQYSPGLPFGGTYEETNSVSLPEQSGTYWLIFQANAYGYLYEADTTNNTLVDSTPVVLTYQVVPPVLAALGVATADKRVVFFPPSPQAPTIPLTGVVKNEGPGPAMGSWQDVVSISTNGTTSGIIGSQGFWQSWGSPGLTSGETYRETNSVSLPEQSGTYWLIFQANAYNELYETNPANSPMIVSTPIRLTYQVVPPDLVPLSLAAASNNLSFSAANPQSQPTVPVIWAVKNQGLGAAWGYWEDTVSVSTDGTTNGIVSSQDLSVDWSAVPLSPDGVYQETNLVTLPGQSGTYWLILQVNNYNYLYEPDVTNNTLIAPLPVTLTTQLTPPDLAPVQFLAASNNVAFYPPSPQASLAAPVVPVVYTVTNLGPGIALGDWYDTVWVSTNSTMAGIVGSQDFYEDWETTGLPAGGSYQRTNSVTLPAQAGTYWLFFQANDYNYLYEADTSNNTMTASVPVSVTLYPVTPPDLAPLSVAPLTSNLAFYASDFWTQPAIAVVYSVTNQGFGAALGYWYDTVWVSTNGTTDGIVSGQDIFEDWNPPGLRPGGTYQCTNTVSLPAQNGTYWLILQVNNYDYLYEADTNNNTLTSSVPVSLTMYPAAPPDLAPVKLAPLSNNVVFHPPDPQSVPSVEVVYAVTNEGGGASGNWVDVVSVSTNAGLSGVISSQNFFESWDPMDLPPGGTYQRTNSVALPAQSGKYWLIFQANAYGWLNEADTTNNTLIDSVPVTLSYSIEPPDLTAVSVAPLATNLSFYPLLPESTSVAVRCVVTNKGAGPAAGAWYDCVYVSTNQTISGAVSSQLFEVQPADPGLPPGGAYQETNYVWLPQRSGKYWLIFQANDYARLYEPNTANNTLVAALPVTLTYGLMAAPGPVTGMLITSNYAVSAMSSTMVWTWSPTAKAGGYQVVLDQLSDGTGQAPVTNQTPSTVYAFTGITPGARCEILVSATNALGAGPISTNLAFAALPALRGLSVRSLTSSSVVFQIVPGLATNYSVAGYYVFGGASTVFETGPGPSLISIQGLRPGRTYAFYFYQHDLAGNRNGPTLATNITTLSSPGNWTPAQLGTKLSLWLDAANAGTLVLNGNCVAQWTDLSGGGNNVTNALAATEPVYQTNGINQRPAVGFTAAGMGLFGAGNFGVSGSAPRTLAVVMDGGLVGTGTAADHEGFGFDISSADATVPYFYDRSDLARSRPPFATNASLFFGEYCNGGGRGYVNGTFFGSNGVAPHTLPGPIQIGKRGDGASRTGRISEVVYLSAELTAPQQHQLEGYLAWKWGLQANLPTNHPYRSAAPLVPMADLKGGYLPEKGIQLQVIGLPAYQYLVLSSTDLTVNATWVPIATNTTAADGTWFFTDTNQCAQPARFYRAMVNLP